MYNSLCTEPVGLVQILVLTGHTVAPFCSTHPDTAALIKFVDFPFHINGYMSQRMMSILGEMAPGQELYSIDESFLDTTGIASYIPLEEFGHQMRNRVRKETGLTIGVGFGPTKTLAKLANHAAKKWAKANLKQSPRLHRG